MRKRHIAPILTVAIVTAFLTTAANASAQQRGAFDFYDYNTDYYDRVDEDQLTFKTQNGGAKLSGGIAWLEQEDDSSQRRGTYGRRAKVRAIKPVGCLWARVKFYFRDPSVGVGSDGTVTYTPGTGIRGGEFAVKCRKPGQRRPKPLSLAGIGFPHKDLTKSIVEIATSRTKRQGPRQNSFEPNSFEKE